MYREVGTGGVGLKSLGGLYGLLVNYKLRIVQSNLALRLEYIVRLMDGISDTRARYTAYSQIKWR